MKLLGYKNTIYIQIIKLYLMTQKSSAKTKEAHAKLLKNVVV